jgi:hypothetical protein
MELPRKQLAYLATYRSAPFWAPSTRATMVTCALVHLSRVSTLPHRGAPPGPSRRPRSPLLSPLAYRATSPASAAGISSASPGISSASPAALSGWPRHKNTSASHWFA